MTETKSLNNNLIGTVIPEFVHPNEIKYSFLRGERIVTPKLDLRIEELGRTYIPREELGGYGNYSPGAASRLTLRLFDLKTGQTYLAEALEFKRGFFKKELAFLGAVRAGEFAISPRYEEIVEVH